MNDKLLIALIAALAAVAGGLITGVVGPWIKHALEQRSALKAQRQEQLRKWRAMLLQVNRECQYLNQVGQLLQVHPDYLSLEPLLTKETRRLVHGENRTVVVGQSLSEPLEKVKEDLARIEKGWGLP